MLQIRTPSGALYTQLYLDQVPAEGIELASGWRVYVTKGPCDGMTADEEAAYIRGSNATKERIRQILGLDSP